MVFFQSKIVFFGTPEFAGIVLESLIKNGFKPNLIITQPDQPLGRKQKLTSPPVKELALSNGLKIAQPKNKIELKKIFEKDKVDLAILVAYGMIIPAEILKKPVYGFLNLHPSLLPKYRGASPIQGAILNGEEKTGVSIIKMTEVVDAGPILNQEVVAVDKNDNNETLSRKLAEVGSKILIETIPLYLEGKIKFINQNESLASFTQIIKRQDGQVDWQKSADFLDRQKRAFSSWPGIFTHLGQKRLKIANLSVLEGDFKANLKSGEVFLGPNSGLAVKCGQGAVELKTVQLEGKKKMTGKDFLRGQKDLVGKILKYF
ncbi:MAG: methionyl-tRNA formyltransferase [Candidatus Buchananbacteria bacterium RIFCSPHIGHO2_01_FULL_39_14]|uniref:Methionyl-tRNA formyltransferase n=1 Tax=Candidatus Buchananbacteria bacterium RIFCSPHIGHO2_01_FULL_39_14 TaxID=1797532 RepID=A0A1G1XWT9_9BACT|nr:MAG: methionyl-tRNA formyltransferase [Candidatus Buchananbacteria bacterium RIFCSPHIGHO2_01_FULL_39_14]